MAKRELEEINAGSMADIAFLLLIFFIVTTTMDLEAGIPQILKMKVEYNGPIPPVNERNVFSININSNNELLVEKKQVEVNEMENMLYEFYTANMYRAKTDPTQLDYEPRERNQVLQDLAVAKQAFAENESDILLESNVLKLEKTLKVIDALPGDHFLQISDQMAIQLKQQSGTSYGTYISVINTIGKVVRRIKNERSKEIFNGVSYDDLDPEIPSDLEKIAVLDIMVPDRTLEPAITK